jgi:hypothetical protein
LLYHPRRFESPLKHLACNDSSADVYCYWHCAATEWALLLYWTVAKRRTGGAYVPQTDGLLRLTLWLASTLALCRGSFWVSFAVFVSNKPRDPVSSPPLSELVLFYPLPILFKIVTTLVSGPVLVLILKLYVTLHCAFLC